VKQDTPTQFVAGYGQSPGYTITLQLKITDMASSSMKLQKIRRSELHKLYENLFYQQEVSLRNQKILSRTAKIRLESYSLQRNPVENHEGAGAYCLLAELNMLDARVPGAGGRVLKMPSLDYWCFHPKRPGLLAEVYYSQRYPGTSSMEASEDWNLEAHTFIESLDFEQ
jgi:hypothetical protein